MPRLELRPVSANSCVVVRETSPMGGQQLERPFTATNSKESSTNASPRSNSSTRLTGFSRRQRSDSAVTPVTPVTSTGSRDEEFCGNNDNDNNDDAGGNDNNSQRCITSLDDWFAQQDAGFDLSGIVSDDCPDRATLAAVQHLPVYDALGDARAFGSLFDPASATHERQLLVFVRHFFCGACQAYLRALAAGIPIRDYFAIPVPTSIIVIGCGQPRLIPHYRAFADCPFPIYADPSRKLFKRLGMTVSANIGRHRPAYMHDISAAQWMKGQATTISRSLKDPNGIGKLDVFRGGNPMQIGGEFLFEDGQVIWCHRMKNYRGHAEVEEVRKVLGLDE